MKNETNGYQREMLLLNFPIY
uniref:Uncharacterized protein n=1 Tax=Anguilla anguilla TaxID=7936 RepID=A0A0E9X9A4_ANGAN